MTQEVRGQYIKISNQPANCDGWGGGEGDDADITYQSETEAERLGQA